MKNIKLKDSFKNAFNGLKLALLSERNMRIHILAAVFFILSGVVLSLDVFRWAVLIIAISMVFIAELINTAIENMVDMVTSEYSEKARIVKDIAAGAVLVTSVIAVILGALVFVDPLANFITKMF